jgi:magnesium-protoporphyrin O-methyltransferase
MPEASDEPRECCFDGWAEGWARRARKKSTIAAVTAPLLAALEDAGIEGRTVLDVGSGIGDLAMETIERGASVARCVELSGRAVREGRRIASERGLAERVSFEMANGADAALPVSDVVVLNRVFCCYPDIDSLLTNSLDAARSVYAFTAPASTGFVGFLNRMDTFISNVWFRLRARKYSGFRVFVHDVAAIDERVRAEGFALRTSGRRRFGWHLAVYSRPAG